MVRPEAMVMANALVADTLLASDTWTVKLAVPPDVGVPLIIPVLPASVSPAGNDPTVIDHEYGEVPSTAVRLTV
jgi:hypothetical protein